MSTLNNEDRDNLAAFLDGELDEDAAQALEAKLNRDPEARKEVEALKQAWSMLDFLPRPEPSPNFTHRTMERLTMSVPRAAATARMKPPGSGHWLRILGWAGAVLLAVTVGGVAGSFLWHGRVPDDPLADVIAQHGTLIDHFVLYEPIIDLEFLKGLDHSELFGEDADELDPHRVGWKLPAAGQKRSLARTFLDLPARRRDEIMLLHKDLFAEPAAVRDRLLSVAQRYRDWFDHLGAKEREKVMSESDRGGRLTVIKGLRHLLRSWDNCVRYWDELNTPFRRMKDMPIDVQEYYKEYLSHMLSPEEKKRLAKAEGQWPIYPSTLVQLADNHPPALPREFGPTKFADLPKEVQVKFLDVKQKPKKKFMEELKAKEGSWPVYAVAVSNLATAKKLGPFPNELWPTTLAALNPPMRAFVNTRLLSPGVLTAQELHKLTEATGKWPDYPRAIEELSKAHRLQPPWFTLPGPRERWDIYRSPKVEP